MIKIRKGTFETNSSSVHTIAWSNEEIDVSYYNKQFTNKIDLYLSKEGEGSFERFEEKLVKLYTFIDEEDYDDLMFYIEDTEFYTIEEAYRANVEINGKKFRDIYKNTKKPLLKIVKEITGKKADIINEEYFYMYTYDMGGFMPSKTEHIREVLTNPDIRILYGCNIQYSDDYENTVITEDDINNIIIKKVNEMAKKLVHDDSPIISAKEIGAVSNINNLKTIYVLIDENLEVKKIMYSKPKIATIQQELKPKDFYEVSNIAVSLYETGEPFSINGIKYKLLELEVNYDI